MEFNKAYSRNEFLSFLRVNFLPEDFKQEIELKNKPVQFQYTQEVTKLGECESLDLIVYEVRHSSKHDARVGLTKEAFRMLADEFCERALVLFVPEDDDSNYRFSLIEISIDQEEKSSKTKVSYSNPHRYSYFLGKGIAYYTPNKYLNEYGRIVGIEDLRNRFSVEVLTKAFYQELSDWYAWAIMVVQFPNDLKTLEDNQKYNSEAMIRLITRLIFVWFLKQRHLVPDEFFDEQFIANELIQGFTPHAETTLFGKAYDSKYYKGVLQNLFFAMLNSPITPEGKDTITERRFRNGRGDYDNNKLMRHEDLFINPDKFVELANKYVPFLNGGLFDCLDDKDKGIYIDAFTDRKVISDQLVIPDFLFFGDEVGKNIDLSEWYGDKKKKKVSARGIIDILKRYNFTVEENTPFDQEVSLDPELLGKVFENLLAAFNPETQTTARKQTGSFYTPREIVHYMVDESLVAHLKRTVGEELEPEYRKLMQYSDEELNLTDEQKRKIMQSLYDCKVLDPACGSGAFPMGMLQQMVHILNRIDPDNTQWKDMMLENAISETSEAYRNSTDDERHEIIEDLERSFNENINRPDYARKLYLIENCVYGVDIQPIAIQISKLRFFISLVVDQKTNNDPVDNFGIRPLPNLEAKFVAANTLIGLEKKEATLFDSEEIKMKEQELIIAKHKIFGAKTVKTKRKYKQIVADLRVEIANMLKDANYVRNEDAEQLAKWDMFDQNTYSPFFDSEWMFGVSDGFDIVIANPPYIEFKKLEQSKKDSISHYEVAKGKYDFFVAFVEKSYYLLKNEGVHCYINPTTFMKRDYGKALRLFIMNRFTIMEIIDFADAQMFENATTYTGIYTFSKRKTTSEYHFPIHIFKNGVVRKSIREDVFVKNNTNFKDFFVTTSNKMTADGWLFTNPTEEVLFNKIFNKTNLTLKDITNYIFEGIATGKDSVFMINESDIVNYSLEKDLIYPILKGKDVNSYRYEWKGVYLIYPYDKDNNVIQEKDLKQTYPCTYSYLCSRRADLSGRDYFEASSKKWYELWCERNLQKFRQIKIVNAEISPENRFAIDKNGYLGNTKIFSTVLSDQYANLYKTILALLNSKLMNYVHKKISTPKAGGSYEYKTQFIEKYPIRIPNNISEYDKLVDKIINNPQEDITSRKEIDILVYRLYDLTYDEVLIVDPNPPFTREEYESKQ